METEMTDVLPEDCVSKIISLTCAPDACKSSVVSRAFKLAADSDAVWENFLPSGYQEIISGSASPSLLTSNLSKKDLYRRLCHNPIIINNGTMSFAIEKKSGKKCFMVGARGLDINEIDDWISVPESRFSRAAYLFHALWFDVKGKIDTKILSPKTTYVVYLVFKLYDDSQSFGVQSSVYIEGIDNGKRRKVLLDPLLSVKRGDDWMEIEMGEFFNENGDDGTLICSLSNEQPMMQYLCIEGIELRPKNGR
ncbi:F-box protein At2g02240-like [Mangifera indica]|uniref:F-box protein At2g02240-like n=1 Tax=Mangifera indica TaxID=29780 RepID=UPI001CFBCFEA|nr:F-box protein At2g02240-like [Mangifera indica]